MGDEFKTRLVELLPRMRRFALSLTGDQDKADDLVQEACMRALANADQWRAGTRLDSWVYKIVQNLYFDRLRAAKVRGVTIDLDDITDLVSEDGRVVTEGRLTLKKVSEQIAELPPDFQILIGLVCLDGLTYKEAAEALSLPIGTVMSRLARARASLHAAIAKSENGPSNSSRQQPNNGGKPSSKSPMKC